LIVRDFLGLSGEAAALSIDPVMPPDLDGLRLRTELLGRPFEVHYRIRGKGCGVTSVAVNGEAVPYSSRANPHRRGAAVVAYEALRPKLSAKANILAIELD